MTWRRFTSLLSGLSPESLTVRLQATRCDEPRPLDGQAAEHYFARIG
jgi:hypothetical protein